MKPTAALVACLLLAGCSSAPARTVAPATSAPIITATTSTTTTPPRMTTPRPAATPAPDKKAQAADIAAKTDKALKSGLAVTSYQEACGKVAWACPIASVEGHGSNVGFVDVHVQEALTAAEANQAALNVFNFAGRDVPELQWVIVYDSSQAVKGQMQRASVPLLQ